MTKKVKYLFELDKARLTMAKTHTEKILVQLNDIKKLFDAASVKNVWQHFTKGQKKNIELWKMDISHVMDEIHLNEDEKENDSGLDTSDQTNIISEINKLEEENEALRCQLEAHEKEKEKMQAEIERALEQKEHELQALINANNNPSPVMHLSESDALLICRLSNFFSMHPFGANIFYICSYLQQIDAKINESDVTDLMTRFPDLYEEFLTGIGASLERNWKYIGFQAFE